MTKKQQRLSLEPDIILQYLLNKLDPSLQRRFRLDYVFRFLGFVGLYHQTDLLEEYCEIDFNPLNALETLNAYQRLFTIAWERGFPEKIEYPLADGESVNPAASKYFLQSATEHGRTMLASGEYRFLSIFVMLCALGVGFNKAATADFESQCLNPDAEPKEKIRMGLIIIEKALRSTGEDKTAANSK
jgi:hypothetical protein